MNMPQARVQLCQGPDPDHREPAFTVPKGACDTHAHVIWPPDRQPFVGERSYTPPEASESAYFAMLDALHMDRGVLVQLSAHGTDNSGLLDVISRHPGRLRGIVALGDGLSEADLRRMHRSGVRGARFNVLFGGGVALDRLEDLARRIAGLGWHVELLIDLRMLPELAPRLRRLPVDVVIDHMGFTPVSQRTGHAGFAALLGMLETGRTWVKLSGANRITVAGAPFLDTIAVGAALVDAAPDRCVWGSDWPHVAVEGPMFKTTDLLDILPSWAPEKRVRDRILVDNPRRLYDFPDDPDGGPR